MLLVKRLSERATLPTRGSMLSAGLDLYSAEKKLVPAGGKALVKTDIAIKCPEEDGPCYARIAPRSGLAWKKSIDVGAGVVDAVSRCSFAENGQGVHETVHGRTIVGTLE